MSQPSSAARRELHRIFTSWLSHASDQETQQLDDLQLKYPPQQVRSMPTFILECLADPARREALPANLLTRLQGRNWPQGEGALRVA